MSRHPGIGKSPLFTSFVFLASVSAMAKDDVSIEASLKMDYSVYDGLHNDEFSGSGAYIRQARVEVKHKLDDKWKAKLELDFDEEVSEVDVIEASIRYDFSSSLALIVGKDKESFGLENSTSSKVIGSLERSIASDIFSPGRSLGAVVEYETDHFYHNVGVYQAAQDEREKAHYAYALRFVYNPITTATTKTHLGLSVNVRDMAGAIYEINSAIEVPVGDKFVESGSYSLKKLQTLAYETAYVYKRLSYQGEYFEQTLSPEGGRPSVEFNGYYASVALFMSNHQREYKNGSFSGVNIDEHGGAWELVGRVGEVQLVDNQIGMIVDSASLSLNYYPNKNVRLTLHTATVDVQSSNPDDEGKATSTTLRLGYQF